MKKNLFSILLAGLMTLSFIAMIMANGSHAQDVAVQATSAELEKDTAVVAPEDATRKETWYTAEKKTTPWGGYVFQGAYGSDLGIGEQGSVYFMYDPATGTQVSYKQEGLGVGQLGVLAGYTGKYSQFGPQQYGIFTGETDYSKLLTTTPGFSTYEKVGGDIMGSFQYSAQQPDYLALAAQQLIARPQTQQLGATLGALSLLGALGGGTYGTSLYSGLGTYGTGFPRSFVSTSTGITPSLGSLGGYTYTGASPSSMTGYYSSGVQQPYAYGYPSAVSAGQPSYTGLYGYPAAQQQYTYGGGITQIPYTTGAVVGTTPSYY
ncbi:MAG: hypothetical protein ACMUJM_23780 [bacterium]